MFDCIHPKLQTRATNILLSDTGDTRPATNGDFRLTEIVRVSWRVLLCLLAVTHVSIKLVRGLPPSRAVCKPDRSTHTTPSEYRHWTDELMKKKERLLKTWFPVLCRVIMRLSRPTTPCPCPHASPWPRNMFPCLWHNETWPTIVGLPTEQIGYIGFMNNRNHHMELKQSTKKWVLGSWADVETRWYKI